MPQYVIEFGAEKLRFIGDAINSSVAEPHAVSVDGAEREMYYADTEKTLREILDDLEVGIATSAVIRNANPRIRYSLITSPKLHVPQLALWMGTIEVCVEDWRFIWNLLLRQAGLKFVCVGAEEGLELSDDQTSPETFPWTASQLLAGAVRADGESEWVVREAASH